MASRPLHFTQQVYLAWPRMETPPLYSCTRCTDEDTICSTRAMGLVGSSSLTDLQSQPASQCCAWHLRAAWREISVLQASCCQAHAALESAPLLRSLAQQAARSRA